MAMILQSAKKETEEFFERGVNKFIDPENQFKNKILEKIAGKYPKDIIVKFGVDPTRPDIHLGHAVIFRKLRKLQEWGCKIVFLVGDFTVQIGDPTGKNKTRPEVEQKEIEKNLKTYLDQVGKILKTDKSVFSWIRNSDWFTSITDLNLPEDYKVNFEIKHDKTKLLVNIPPNSFVGKAIVFEKSRMQVKDLGIKDKISAVTLKSFLWGLKHFTLAQLIERDMFQERIKKGRELYMHEVLYPIFQGIDSQILSQIYGSCDLEIGGSDQLFNMMIGRETMKFNKQSPQSVLAMSLLVGLDGKEKMSKSLDNYIALDDSPRQMFGKVMSISDSLIADYFTLATYSPIEDIKEMSQKIEKREVNPRDFKSRLAREIVSEYHGEKKADEAEKDFFNIFREKQTPADLPVIKVDKNRLLSEILLSYNFVGSKTKFKRLIAEGAVSDVLGKKKITDLDFTISEDSVFKIGKKRFVNIKIKS